MSSKKLPHALEYAKHGWHVFPLHHLVNGKCSCGKSPCGDAGKHPRIKNGLLGATTDPRTIKNWWNKWPEANIGVRTGAVSGIIVLDIDPKHRGDETLYELENQYGELPETVEAKTGGGGRHIVLKHPGFNVKTGTGILGEGIDIRGDGGYIVAPPSKHASGNIYSWDIASKSNGIAEMPPWLAEMVKETNLGVPEKVEGDIPEGQRHNTLLSFAGSMRRRGMVEDSIYAALQVENQYRCRPPLDDREVKRIAYSMSKYPAENPPKGGKNNGNRKQPKGEIPASCLPPQFFKT